MILQIILLILVIVLFLIVLYLIWEHLRKIYHKKSSFFDFAFIILYFTEQALFLLLYHLEGANKELLIALIVLIVITTASTDKFMMKTIHNQNARTIQTSLWERNRLFDTIYEQDKEIKLLENENEKILNFIKKRLKKKR